mgnify:CR=1 FL=1
MCAQIASAVACAHICLSCKLRVCVELIRPIGSSEDRSDTVLRSCHVWRADCTERAIASHCRAAATTGSGAQKQSG